MHLPFPLSLPSFTPSEVLIWDSLVSPAPQKIPKNNQPNKKHYSSLKALKEMTVPIPFSFETLVFIPHSETEIANLPVIRHK